MPEPVGIGVSGRAASPPVMGGSSAVGLGLFAKSGLPLGDEAAVIVDLHRHLPLALSSDRNPSVLILVELLDPRIAELSQPGMGLPLVLHRVGGGRTGA